MQQQTYDASAKFIASLDKGQQNQATKNQYLKQLVVTQLLVVPSPTDLPGRLIQMTKSLSSTFRLNEIFLDLLAHDSSAGQ